MAPAQHVEDGKAVGGETTVVEVASPVEAAKEAGLRYVSDTQPGIQRKRVGKNFS